MLVARLGLRSATALTTLLLISAAVFAMVQLAPGDPLADDTEQMSSQRIPPERRAELRALYHLDEPVHRQYALWLSDVLRGDLGRSFFDRRPVSEKIGERLGLTLTLNLLALLLMVPLSIVLGAAAAWRPGSLTDHLTAGMTYALYAMPVFWAALLLQLVFAVRLRWLPLYGLPSPVGPVSPLTTLAHLILPVICLAYGGVAYLSRFVRNTFAENLRGDAVRAARARGASLGAVLLRHGFRQAAVPMLTLAGFLLPGLVVGSVIVEHVFALPGLGRLFVDAVFQRDIPVIMGLTLLTATATLAGILLADLAYAIFDPRIRRG